MERKRKNKKRRVLPLLLACTMVSTSVFAADFPNVNEAKEAKAADDLQRRLIPKPLEFHQDEEGRKFVLESDAAIYVSGNEEVERTGDYLQEEFGRSTGYELPVKEGTNASAKDILLATDGAESLGEEGYTIEVDEDGIKVSAYQPEGVFNGVQTLRQLFPADIEKTEVVDDVEWVAPYCDINDKPEYNYRGMMLDVARHFFPVDSVKRQIDYMAKYKMNKLHIHMTDDQGWRLEMKGEMYGESLDKLRTIGASRSCSTNGYRPGQFTQEEFKELADYAADRYVEIIPEFDMPSHAWAAMVSLNFLNSTEDGKPHWGNYDNTQPYDGWDVGFASLECRNENTYEFIEEVIKQVAPLYPSKYIHIGGDEAHNTDHADYIYFMQRVTEIALKYGKTPIGWQNYDNIELENRDQTVTQFWSTGNAQFKSGVNYVVSAADHAYLDMKYNSSCPYGLSWASMNPIDDAYNWDPTNYGSKDQIVGIEAPMFGETLAEDDAWDYMIYPRLMGHAEVGWTPKANRDFGEYRTRMIAHGQRLKNQGIKFYEDEDYWTKPVPPVSAAWPMDDGEGTTVTDVNGGFPGTIVGDVAWVDGKYGKALNFTSGYVDLNVEGMKKEWTIGVWVNREDNPATNSSLISSTTGELKLEQYNGTNKVGVTEFGNDDWTFNYEAPVGEWVHLAFVSDGTKTSLYVNGELQDTMNHAIAAPVVRLGANAKGGLKDAGLIKGTLDDLKILNRALSTEEVAGLMEEGTMPVDTTFLAAEVEAAEKVNLDEYVTTGKATFEAAKAAAVLLLQDPTANQGQINAACQALETARLALTPKADKSQLAVQVENAKKALDSDEWSEESKVAANLQAIYENAKALFDDPELSVNEQEQVQNAIDDIQNALKKLVPDGEELPEMFSVHMKFDEGEGTSVADTKGTYTANMSGSVTWVDGKYGKALSFDEGVVDLGINEIDGDWTIGMWVKREANDRTNTALISGREGELKLEQWKNTQKVGISKYGVDDWTFEYSAPDGEWVHLTFVGANRKTALYVNGEKQGEVDAFISAPTLALGANTGDGFADRGYMKGSIDDLKIFEGALTEEQIQEMMKAVADESIDKEDLAALIEYAQGLKENEEDYKYVVPAVKKAFEAALEAAVAVNDNAATQAEVNAAYEKLLKMVHMLGFTGNSESLKIEADSVRDMNPDLFTEESWKVLADALAKADEVLANENALQDEIDAAKTALQEAKKDLVKITVKKDALKKLIDRSQKYVDTIDKYTPETAKLFNDVLADATKVYEDAEATQKEVNSAYDALQSAIFQLRLIPDKNQLEGLIKSAESVDTANYTVKSATAFAAALDNAKAVFADENATEEDVKSAEKALEEAQKNLVAKEDTDKEADKEAGDKADNNVTGKDDDKADLKVASDDGGKKSDAKSAAKTGDAGQTTAVMMIMLMAGTVVAFSFRRKKANTIK